MQRPYMARESVLRSDVRIDICRIKDEICARVRDTEETKRGGYGDENEDNEGEWPV